VRHLHHDFEVRGDLLPPAAGQQGDPLLCGVQTVAGLLVQALGRIPRPGERFALHGLEFDILAATATRVERVAVRPGPVRTVPLEPAEDRI